MAQWYSNINSIHLQNFMSHSDTLLTFDDSNIIDLCGYNDSGKTAIGYALDVLLYDGSSTLQSSYIKEGESFFRVELTFDDGVAISKTKDTGGKSIWVMTKDGCIIYTNKKDTGVIATDGVPQEIAKYLGVVYDEITEQKLNIRTKRDKALLTETTGGENYKMFSTICNSEVLSEASRAMTEKKNKLNQDIASKATTLTAYHNQFMGMDTPSENVLDDLHTLTENLRGIGEKSKAIEGAKSSMNVIQETVIPAELNTLDMKQLNDIMSAISLNEAMNTDVYPEIIGVDTTQFALISKCVQLSKELECDITPEITGTNCDKLRDIVNVVKMYNDYSKQYRDYTAVQCDYERYSGELSELCKQNNIRICENCGAAVTGGHEHV